MHARHHIADNLRHLVRRLTGRGLVGTAKRHERMRALHFLGVVVAEVELAHDLLRDRIAAHRHTANKHPPLLQKNQVRRTRSDVHHQRAVCAVRVIVPHGVVERHGRNIHQVRLQTGLISGIGQRLHDVGLDGG